MWNGNPYHCGKPLDNRGRRPYSTGMDTTPRHNIIPELVCETIEKLQDRSITEVHQLRSLAIKRGNRARNHQTIRACEIYITACDVVISGGRV